MRRILISAWLAALAACAGPAKTGGLVTPTPEVAPPLERWVNPGVPLSGDGSREKPFKSLEEALQGVSGPAVLHLATGMYRGPFRTPAGLRIEGSRATLLYVESGDEVFAPQGDLALSNLVVQGGRVGIRSSHRLELDRVELSGQRMTAVAMKGGLLRARNSIFAGTLSETVGVHAVGPTTVELTGASFTGAFRRAVLTEEGAVLKIGSSRFEGPATAVHAVRTDAVLQDVEVSGGRGTGIFAAGGVLKLSSVRVFGHEYAVLARDGARVEATDLSCVRPDRAGIGLVEATGRLERVLIVETGSYGAIHQVGGQLELRGFFIRAADAYGINVAAGRLVAEDGAIVGVGDTGGGAGDGIHLRRSRARISGVSVLGTVGSGILAAEGSEVALRDLVLERNKWGGVLAETGARVEATSIAVRDSSSAIAVPGAALVKVDAVTALDAAQGLVWAECSQGAEVQLARTPGAAIKTTVPCVGIWKNPKVFDPLSAKP